MLVFSGLFAGYGSVPVLRELRGTIRPGTFTALIGPNGSGKSTFLRALSGLLPYKGNLKLDGRELSRIPRRELGRLVGVVPQQVRMAAPFSVYEAIALGRLPHQGLTTRPSAEDERLILDAASRTDLERLLFHVVTRLSGGETQRVLLATVLAQDPLIFLLDEPSSALDPYQTVKVFSLLRRMAHKGKTVVAAVHDVNLAVAFADVFLGMKSGRILFDASVPEMNEAVLEELYETPFESYTSESGGIVWHPRDRKTEPNRKR